MRRVLVVLTAAAVFGGPAIAACKPSGGSADCRALPARSGQVRSVVLVVAADGARPAKPKPGPAKDRIFNCGKGDSPVWRRLQPYRNGIKTNGKSGRAARFYEWDNTHNDIEEYGPAPGYKHLGSLDPDRGRQYKPAVPGRDLKDALK